MADDTSSVVVPTGTVGGVLRFWRQRRRLSQLDLAVGAGVSQRHLSFIETGRSQPSRELLAHLASHLELPLRARNQLLLAGGYAPIYRELDYTAPAMEPLRQSLRLLLDAHQPNPALIVDRYWNLLDANPAAALLTDGVAQHLLEPPVNLLRLAFHPDGLPRISKPSPACSLSLFHHVQRQAHDNADIELTGLLTELRDYLPAPPALSDQLGEQQALASFELNTRLGGVRLFTVIATLGAPIEVTAAALAIETFLPADPTSAERLRHLAEALPPTPADDTALSSRAGFQG
jgi:transcriptional regulator with XRE-family HTH domain